MRQKIYLLILCTLSFVTLSVQTARANDFLEKEKHYSAYTAGANKIHFKIPLFSESESGYSYFVKTDADGHNSFLFYDTDTQTGVPFAYIGSENKDEGHSHREGQISMHRLLRQYRQYQAPSRQHRHQKCVPFAAYSPS